MSRLGLVVTINTNEMTEKEKLIIIETNVTDLPTSPATDTRYRYDDAFRNDVHSRITFPSW